MVQPNKWIKADGGYKKINASHIGKRCSIIFVCTTEVYGFNVDDHDFHVDRILTVENNLHI